MPALTHKRVLRCASRGAHLEVLASALGKAFFEWIVGPLLLERVGRGCLVFARLLCVLLAIFRVLKRVV